MSNDIDWLAHSGLLDNDSPFLIWTKKFTSDDSVIKWNGIPSYLLYDLLSLGWNAIKIAPILDLDSNTCIRIDLYIENLNTSDIDVISSKDSILADYELNKLFVHEIEEYIDTIKNTNTNIEDLIYNEIDYTYYTTGEGRYIKTKNEIVLNFHDDDTLDNVINDNNIFKTFCGSINQAIYEITTKYHIDKSTNKFIDDDDDEYPIFKYIGIDEIYQKINNAVNMRCDRFLSDIIHYNADKKYYLINDNMIIAIINLVHDMSFSPNKLNQLIGKYMEEIFCEVVYFVDCYMDPRKLDIIYLHTKYMHDFYRATNKTKEIFFDYIKE